MSTTVETQLGRPAVGWIAGIRDAMLSRFVSNLLLVVTASVLAAVALALSPAVTTWVALGGGSGVVAITALAFLARDRGAAQRALDAPIAIIGGWMIVDSRAFAGSTVRWLTFGEAAALATLTVVGLIAHEALSERAIRRMFGNSATAGELVVQRRRTTSIDSGR